MVKRFFNHTLEYGRATPFGRSRLLDCGRQTVDCGLSCYLALLFSFALLVLTYDTFVYFLLLFI